MEGSVPTENKFTLGVPKERDEGERRIALIPDAVKKYAAAGLTVLVESSAGEGSFFSDSAYQEAGGTIVPSARDVFNQSDLVLKVQRPTLEEINQMKPGASLVAFLSPMTSPDLVNQLLDHKLTSFSMDAIPRTTRAQTMDALSSMATVAGYKAVLLASDHLAKFFPLLMTAAGTIPPAKVLVIGAGVAGLQAIATARRLGAVVEAYDTRPVVKEQVESLGAKFVDIDTGVSDTQDSGGYAKEATADVIRRQQEVLAERASKADAIITTAAVPGRPAPRLISEETVKNMADGSVIVDLAAETGGNCELTVRGETVERHGVTIIGMLNLPSTIPVHASQMYSKNIQNLLALMIDANGVFSINLDDDIVRGTIITRDGALLHEGTKARMQPAPEPEPAAATEPPPQASQPPTDTLGKAADPTASQDEASQQGSVDSAQALNELVEDVVTPEPAEVASQAAIDGSPMPSDIASESDAESSESADSSTEIGAEGSSPPNDSNTRGGA